MKKTTFVCDYCGDPFLPHSGGPNWNDLSQISDKNVTVSVRVFCSNDLCTVCANKLVKKLFMGELREEILNSINRHPIP